MPPRGVPTLPLARGADPGATGGARGGRRGRDAAGRAHLEPHGGAVLAGTTAAAALFLQTLLVLVDSTGLLPRNPAFRETGAGPEQDLATYYVAYFERQHDIAWILAIRGTLGPLAALAMIVLALAFVQVRGHGRPRVHVWALVFAVGALLNLLSDLVYLSLLGVWRFTGFTAEPPADMIASGRSAETVADLSSYLATAASVTLAAALVGVAAELSARLRILALALAAVAVVAVVASLAFWDVVADVTSILTGAVLGPLLLVGLGRWIARSVDRRA